MNRPLPTEIVGSFMERVPVDVEGLARALGLAVVFEPMVDNLSGKIEKRQGGSYTITVNANHGARRKRFTIAHEIAHHILHRDLIGHGIVDDGLYRSQQPSQIERQANQYTADILMPTREVRSAASRGTHSAVALADLFKVSSAVADIRIKEVGL